MQTITCTTCNQTMPTSMFPTHGRNSYTNLRDGVPDYESRCRPCKAAYAREYRKLKPGYRGTGKIKSIPQDDRLLASAISHRLTCAKQRAEKYGGPATDINRDYLYQLFKEQGGRCALTGASLKIEKKAITCLSLDQKEPALGYVKGNVQWVAWAANRAKGDMPQDVFVDMCRQVMEYQKVQRLSPSGSTSKWVEAQNPGDKPGEDIV